MVKVCILQMLQIDNSKFLLVENNSMGLDFGIASLELLSLMLTLDHLVFVFLS